MNQPQVIAVDLDGTLCQEICWDEQSMLNATPVKKVVDWVNLKYLTNYIIIYTARRPELYLPTRKWLIENGIKFHALEPGKMPADLYIDDKSLRPEEL